MSILRSLSLASLLGLAACSGGGASSLDSASTTVDPLDNVPGGGQVCQAGTPDARACDPADTAKTTVCHIPPGNPANAHTICVGNAAVPAHMAHGDVLGSCCATSGGGGTSGSGGGGTAGSGGGGTAGSGGGGSAGSGGGGSAGGDTGGSPGGVPDAGTGSSPIP